MIAYVPETKYVFNSAHLGIAEMIGILFEECSKYSNGLNKQINKGSIYSNLLYDNKRFFDTLIEEMRKGKFASKYNGNNTTMYFGSKKNYDFLYAATFSIGEDRDSLIINILRYDNMESRKIVVDADECMSYGIVDYSNVVDDISDWEDTK